MHVQIRFASCGPRRRPRGTTPNRWFNNVEIIASKRIGRETVPYVGNIYKYYQAYKMVTEKDAQRQAARQNSASRENK